jgi:antitoxin PrlF
MYKAKITSKGQITLPAALRKELGVKTGDSVMFVPEKNGAFRVRRAPYS